MISLINDMTEKAINAHSLICTVVGSCLLWVVLIAMSVDISVECRLTID